MGGMAEGVRQLAMYLGKLGYHNDVLTLDDPAQSFVTKYEGNAIALGPSVGGYGYNKRLIPWLKTHAAAYDAVIVNGLWQYHSFAVWQVLPKHDIPYHVYTHGMLDPWFKREYPLKHVKKWMYWPWADYRVLRDARLVLFTSEDERLLARQSFWLYKANECVVTYGTSRPPRNTEHLKTQFLAVYPALRGKRVLLFLSRLHEKKGCDLLIRAFGQISVTDPSLHLVMAGPDQKGMIAKLKKLATEMEVSDRITWPGMLQADMKWGAFYCAEAFILPSHQENFGIAVAEAMSCGLPVLISDKINIWREIMNDGAGLVAADTLEGTQQNLEKWRDLTTDERLAMSQRAVKCFEQRFTVKAMATALLGALQIA
jgi:glycosyltransferase involved in cell wall biosynthesis